MSTPEGRVKAGVKAVLAELDIRNAKDAGKYEFADGWYYMPGQSGFGVNGIPDFIGHFRGRFFAVETKAPGKVPTGFQSLQIEGIRCSKGKCFVIRGGDSLREFARWLYEVKEESG